MCSTHTANVYVGCYCRRVCSQVANALDCKLSGQRLTPGCGRVKDFSHHLCGLICASLAFVCTALTKMVVHIKDPSPCGLTFTWWGCCGLCQRHKPTKLAHSFKFSPCVYFCLYGPFNCISFHKFSQQLTAFSLCFSGLISALLVLSAMYLSIKVSLSPDVIPCGWLGLKHQLTNS